MDEEQQSRIGIALVAATVLALVAIAAAETFGFVLFEDSSSELIVTEAHRQAAERHAHIFAAMAQCLNEPTVITVAGQPAAKCRPIK